MTPEELAEDLIGTARTCCVADHLHSDDEVRRFNQLAFECGRCGWWWCSTDELNNDGPEDLCDECAQDETEDDE